MMSSISAATLPHKKRKSSNASSDVESETGKLLDSLGSPGSSLADVGTGLQGAMTPPKPQGPSSLEATHVHFPNELPHLHSSHDDEESASQNGSSKASRNLPERRLQPKKRKMSMESFDMSFVDRRRNMSHESYDSAMGDSVLGLNSASMESSVLPKLPDVSSLNSKNSGGSAQVKEQQQQYDHAPIHGVLALEHLDALGDEKAALPKTGEDADKKPSARAKSEDEDKKPAAVDKRQRADSFGHLQDGDIDDNSSNDTFTSSGHRLLMEAIMMSSGQAGLDGAGRKRLESWGGMSDLSYHGGDQGNAAAAIAASALHHTGIIDDVTAAANFGDDSVNSSVSDMEHWRTAPPFKRDRKESSTSFSDSTFPFPASLESVEVAGDLQKFVAAAVASVGDQLAELAGAVESAASGADIDSYSKKSLVRARLDSETSSIATPVVIGASVEDASTGPEKHRSIVQQDDDTTKALEAAATAAAISVDYDAVAAAVDAANAATGALDLSAIDENHNVFHTWAGSVSSRTKGKRKLPVHNRKQHDRDAIEYSAAPDQPVSASAFHSMPPPKSTLSEAEQEAIRERARRAAGYVPPAQQGKTPQKQSLPPLKKRKKLTPEPERAKTFTHETPRVSNISQKPDIVPSEIFSGVIPPAGDSFHPVSGSKAAAAGQSTQKWESMFDCLLEFIEERKQEDLKGATQEENDAWQWDGNVPTTYKTNDGKALGRWINNQRSAKSKGTLKKDREKRLVDAGLKWSVLASNSWNEMLDELRDYVKEYTKDGKKWDGNVPTNYRIKAKPNGKKLTEEDKNLGRWVNRQRSLFQAGKLRKDRQLALENIGLKWSMLATTSWDSMFETLVEYVQQKTKDGSKWDGNVPANYRTDDNPPRALGRWINRQRSAHVKKKLKQEYVKKLSDLGLKWSVHERRFADDSSAPVRPDDAPSSAPTSDAIPSTIAVPASVADNTPSNDRASKVETSNVESLSQKEESGSGVTHSELEVDQRRKTVADVRKTDNAESSTTPTESGEVETASDIGTEKSHNCSGTTEEMTKTTRLNSVEPNHHVKAGLSTTSEASMEAAKSDTVVETDEPKQSQTDSIEAENNQYANGRKESRRCGEISVSVADIAVIGKKSNRADANTAKLSSELTQTIQSGEDPSSNDTQHQESLDDKQVEGHTVSKHVNDVNAEVKMRGACENKPVAAKSMVEPDLVGADEGEANSSRPIDGSASPAKKGNERVLSAVLSTKSRSLSSKEKGYTERKAKTTSENADSSSKSVRNDSVLRKTGGSGEAAKEGSAQQQATEPKDGNALSTDGPNDLPLRATSDSCQSKGKPVQGKSEISESEAQSVAGSAPTKKVEKVAATDNSHRRQGGTNTGVENPEDSETANKLSQSGANNTIADKDEDNVKAGESRQLLRSGTNREQQPQRRKLETKRNNGESTVKQTNKVLKENDKPMTRTLQSKINAAEKPVTRSKKAYKKASDTTDPGGEIEQSPGRSVERTSTRRSRRKAQRAN